MRRKKVYKPGDFKDWKWIVSGERLFATYLFSIRHTGFHGKNFVTHYMRSRQDGLIRFMGYASLDFSLAQCVAGDHVLIVYEGKHPVNFERAPHRIYVKQFRIERWRRS